MASTEEVPEGGGQESGETRPAASERLQSVADALLMQLATPDKSAQAISFVRETNTLQWMSRHPALFARFLGTCAARNHADVLQHAAFVCPGCLAALRDRHGNTLLHISARHGSLLTLNRLLDLGTDPHVCNDKKETVLHVMARRTFVAPKPRAAFGFSRTSPFASRDTAGDGDDEGAAAVAQSPQQPQMQDAAAAGTAAAAGGTSATLSPLQQPHSMFSFGRHKHSTSGDGAQNSHEAAGAAEETGGAEQTPSPAPGEKEQRSNWRSKASMYLQMHPFKKSASPASTTTAESDSAASATAGTAPAITITTSPPATTTATATSGTTQTTTEQENEDERKKSKVVEAFRRIPIFKKKGKSPSASPILGCAQTPAGEDAGDESVDEHSVLVVEISKPLDPLEMSEATVADIDDDEMYHSDSEDFAQRQIPGPSALRNSSVADFDGDEGDASDKDDERDEAAPNAAEDEGDDEEEDEDEDEEQSDSEEEEEEEDTEGDLIMMAIAEEQQKTSANDATGSSGQHKEKKEVDWNKFSDDGSLEKAVQKMKAEELLAFTVQRLCQLIGPDGKNVLGRTPLELAVKYRNEAMAKVLRECGAAEAAGPASSSSRGALGKKTGASLAAVVKRLAEDPTGRYIQSVRDIMDRTPSRAPLCRLVLRPRSKYRVLSMDGGGIRCLMHPIILRRVLARYPTFLDCTALFCGCSGSAAMATMLVCGFTPEQVGACCELSAMRTLRKPEGNGVTGVKFTSQWLRLMADLLYGDIRLKDLARHVLIPAYQLDNGAPAPDRRKGETVLMHNLVPGPTSDITVTDACMRSSAAPTYFRCYQGFVDGGVFANNPSACAWPVLLGPAPHGLALAPADLVCLSLGTGNAHRRFIDDERLIDGGIYQWGLNVLDLFNTAALEFNDSSGRLLLGDRYYRHHPCLLGQGPIKLDNWKCAPILKNFAETIPLDPLFAWIEKYWF